MQSYNNLLKYIPSFNIFIFKEILTPYIKIYTIFISLNLYANFKTYLINDKQN
jgi:hypothetical protein